jgi:hypothetical protein
VFNTPVGARTPTQKMAAKQERKTARAVLNVEKITFPYAKHIPEHLRGKSVIRTLGSPMGQDILNSVQAVEPKPDKGGFKLSPLGVVSDIPKELEGTGMVEKGILKLGAMSGAGWQSVGLKPVGKVAQDAFNIAGTTLPALYLPARAAATGHPGEAAKMFTAPIVQTLEHPVKSFKEHPVGTALIFRGAEGALSRTAGATARSGVLGDAAAEATSLRRVPLQLAGSAVEQRRASKGLVENLAQKAVDRSAVKQGRGVFDEHGDLQAIRATPPAERRAQGVEAAGAPARREAQPPRRHGVREGGDRHAPRPQRRARADAPQQAAQRGRGAAHQ